MNKVRETLINEITNECKNNKIVESNLLFISLLGSTRTNEEVENYSDLDILFILKSDSSGTIAQTALKELKGIAEAYSRKYNIETSFLTHTLFDFEEYVDFAYLTHYSWGKVLFGDKSEYEKIFKNIIAKKSSDRERKELIYYNLVHARFNLIRKYVSWNEHNTIEYKKKLIKLIIDNVIEICDWALIYRGIFKKTKKEILREFSKGFDLSYKYIPEQAYKIRSNWSSLTFEENSLDLFIDESILFVQALIETIHSENESN